MALTKEEIAKLDEAGLGGSAEEAPVATGKSLSERLGLTAIPKEPSLMEKAGGAAKTFISGVNEEYKKAGEKVKEGITEGANKYSEGVKKAQEGKTLKEKAGGLAEATGGLLESGLRTASAGVSSVFAPITQAVKQTIDGLSDHISNNETLQKLAQTEGVGKVLDTLNVGGQKYEDFAKEHPSIAKNIEDGLNVTLGLVGSEGLNKPVAEAFSDISKPFKSAFEKGKAAIKEGEAASQFSKEMAQGKPALTLEKQVVDKKVLDNITPNTKDLTPTEYEDLLRKGKITPKTTTEPSKYVLSDAEKAVAKKYEHLLQDTDPVKNSTNLINEIVKKDGEVGKFLEKNNTKIDPQKMKSYLTDKMKDITDITVDEARLNTQKQRMVDNFVDGLKEKDVLNAWKDRKAFDVQIEKAFKGSPTLAKEVKKGLRNGVQDFIAENTPDSVYKDFMKDMTQLFDLQETVATKAVKERGINAIQAWIKANPTKAKVIGWGTAIPIIGGLGKEGLNLITQ